MEVSTKRAVSAARSLRSPRSVPTARTATGKARPAAAPARRAGLSRKLQRGDLLAEACPSREVLKHVTSRWGVLVLMVLETRMHRFAELRRAIGGVSERMLAQTLQWLEGDGLVLRIAHEVVPPHVEYRLTPLGRAAAKRVRALADWIEINLPQVMAAQSRRANAR